MSVVISQEKYARLLADSLPRVLDSREDHQKMMTSVIELMKQGDSLSAEEVALLELMAVLIADYESKYVNSGEPVTPLQMLDHLMDAHGHTAKDLWDVIGDKGTVSKILNAERNISKAQAKRLGKFYHVSAAHFI